VEAGWKIAGDLRGDFSGWSVLMRDDCVGVADGMGRMMRMRGRCMVLDIDLVPGVTIWW
jgi:hypothetical protein